MACPLWELVLVRRKLIFGAVKAHVRDVIAGIAPHDSEERFRGLGVNVIKSEAQLYQ